MSVTQLIVRLGITLPLSMWLIRKLIGHNYPVERGLAMWFLLKVVFTVAVAVIIATLAFLLVSAFGGVSYKHNVLTVCGFGILTAVFSGAALMLNDKVKRLPPASDH